MDPTYIESVWWAVKTIWDKGLIYEGRKVLMYCPRCQTPISKAEVAMDNSYKDVTEEAVTVKLKIKNSKIDLVKDAYVLAWTTTPWTLPGNVALAVGDKIKYVLIRVKGQEGKYILAKNRLKDIGKHKVIKELKGKDLIGLEYEPLYEIPAVRDSGKKAWHITDADFVNTEEGTGIVHTAVIYGEDDYNLGVEKDLPMVPLLNGKGIFNNEAPKLIRGKYFKDSEKYIKDDIEKRGLLFSSEEHTHSYPFCWRCDTQLFYNAISAWFVDVQKIKKRLIKLNDKINWYPGHLKKGRFLNILKTAPDWNISRNRYWASPLPFWKCDCGYKECIGSVEELKKKAVNFREVYKTDKVEKMDLHKHKIDKIILKCHKCGKEMNRIPEVIDCWVESASMPFAEFHFPFENQKVFKERFPAQYIAEYIAQTRTWFYYMHVMAVLLFDDISFENVVTTGTILNEKGEKLSKSKNNYTDPWIIINNYGVDALRYYLMSGAVMQADNLFFNDREVRDVYNKVINILWNVKEFYKMYAGKTEKKLGRNLNNVLDKWILSNLNFVIKEVTEQMDNYNTVKSCRLIRDFIDNLSLWYVRRSRSRFKEEGKDKDRAEAVLSYVLMNFSKVIAPFMPFISESIYQEVKSKKDEESVHLCRWPEFDNKVISEDLNNKMKTIREIVSLALAERSEKGIKVRQPLAKIKIKNKELKGEKELLDLIKDEVNVEKVIFDAKIKKEVELDTNITKELEEKGNRRELLRKYKNIRKEANLVMTDRIFSITSTSSDVTGIADKQFKEELNADEYQEVAKEIDAGDFKKEIKIKGSKHYIGIKINNKK